MKVQSLPGPVPHDHCGAVSLREICGQALSVGFTGTREGVSHEQYEALGALIKEFGRATLHHGDCLGADVSAHNAAGCFKWRRVAHPATNAGRWRAWCTGLDAIRAGKPALERNHDIVDETHALIACPGGFAEELRSGTWATVRYARKLKRPIWIVWPDGAVSAEPGDHIVAKATRAAKVVGAGSRAKPNQNNSQGEKP